MVPGKYFFFGPHNHFFGPGKAHFFNSLVFFENWGAPLNFRKLSYWGVIGFFNTAATTIPNEMHRLVSYTQWFWRKQVSSNVILRSVVFQTISFSHRSRLKFIYKGSGKLSAHCSKLCRYYAGWWGEECSEQQVKPENDRNTQIRFKYKYKYTRKDKKYNTKIQTQTNITIGSLSQIRRGKKWDFLKKKVFARKWL